MTISCSCDFDGYDAEWYFDPPTAPKPLESGTPCKCCSCGEELHHGDLAQILARWRYIYDDEEGEDDTDQIYLEDWHRCPYCVALANIVISHGACYDAASSIERQLIEHITDGEPCEDGQDPAAVLLHDLFEAFVGRLDGAS